MVKHAAICSKRKMICWGENHFLEMMEQQNYEIERLYIVNKC